MAENQRTENGQHINEEHLETVSPEVLYDETDVMECPNNVDENSAVQALVDISNRLNANTSSSARGNKIAFSVEQTVVGKSENSTLKNLRSEISKLPFE